MKSNQPSQTALSATGRWFKKIIVAFVSGMGATRIRLGPVKKTKVYVPAGKIRKDPEKYYHRSFKEPTAEHQTLTKGTIKKQSRTVTHE
ncbi:MAG: hypothetical protein JXJ22_18340 [Bacteroidales bacterium]|nr:hypothetical protein [Bacteroidales bacterium]